MPFPCDRYINSSDEAYFRAIDVKAPTNIFYGYANLQLILQLWLDWPRKEFFQVNESISGIQRM